MTKVIALISVVQHFRKKPVVNVHIDCKIVTNMWCAPCLFVLTSPMTSVMPQVALSDVTRCNKTRLGLILFPMVGWWERWPITSFTAVGEDLDVSRIESWEIPKPEYGLRPTHPSPVSPLSPHHLHIIGSAVSEG